MGEYLQEQYRNSIKELNDIEQKWREAKRKASRNKFKDEMEAYKKIPVTPWTEWYGQDEYSIKNCPKLNLNFNQTERKIND